MSKKRWFIAYSKENIALIGKNALYEVWSTIYTRYVKFGTYITQAKNQFYKIANLITFLKALCHIGYVAKFLLRKINSSDQYPLRALSQ